MKDKIKQTILTILEQKRRDGDVLPYATSIEVAHLLNMNALEVEKMAEGIEGIESGKTLNCAWYDIKGATEERLNREREKRNILYRRHDFNKNKL